MRRRSHRDDLKRLLAEREGLVRRLLFDVRASPLRDHGCTDGEERVQAELQQELTAGLLEQHAEARTRIQEALRRPATRRDVCARCGGAIGRARLRAVPFTELCRSCQEREEARRTPAARPGPLLAR